MGSAVQSNKNLSCVLRHDVVAQGQVHRGGVNYHLGVRHFFHFGAPLADRPPQGLLKGRENSGPGCGNGSGAFSLARVAGRREQNGAL
jgi:hypothetical protein